MVFGADILPLLVSHLTRGLLTISDVSEFNASSTVGLWRSDADVFSGDEFPEKAMLQEKRLKVKNFKNGFENA